MSSSPDRAARPVPAGPPGGDGLLLGSRLAAGQCDARETATQALRRAATDSAFLTVTAARAVREAEAAHQRLADGRPASALDGVPLAVKDAFDVAGTTTTAGSPLLAERRPATADAPVVNRLRDAGMVLTGKTNQSELSFSGLGVNPHYGTPPHPEDDRLLPGGSSSGSAVAVATGIVPIALGTDTSGSVRVPAAFCGIYGYKASENRYSREGIHPLSTTLDSVGVLARSARDIVAVDRLLAPGPRVPPPQPGEIRLVAPLGELLDHCTPEVRQQFEDALAALAAHGVRVDHRALPALTEAQTLMDTHTTIVGTEAYRANRHLLQQPARDRTDPGLIRRLTRDAKLHHTAPPVYRAKDPLRRRLPGELGDALLVCPTVRHTPPALQPLLDDPGLYDDTNRRTLRTTMLLSYLGMPGISLPLGTPDTARTGLLLSAPVNHDVRLLAATTTLAPLLGPGTGPAATRTTPGASG